MKDTYALGLSVNACYTKLLRTAFVVHAIDRIDDCALSEPLYCLGQCWEEFLLPLGAFRAIDK